MKNLLTHFLMLQTELIAAGGPISWLEHGLSAASVKVQRLR